MTRKFSAMVLTALLVLGTVTGCSGKSVMAPSGDNGMPDGTQDIMQDDNTNNSGVITLKVWAEEAQHSTVQKMIDSFIEQYKGQADFDMRHSLIQPPEMCCLAMCRMGRMSFRSRMTSSVPW